MEYYKGNCYMFSHRAKYSLSGEESIFPEFDLHFDTEGIRFLINKEIIFDIPTKLLAQVLKDSLQD